MKTFMKPPPLRLLVVTTALLGLLSIHTVAGDDSPTVFCNICRDFGTVTNPSGTIARAGDLPISCAQADAAGLNFFFTLDECFVAQALAAAESVCGCTGAPPGPPSLPPVPAPMTPGPVPTEAPVPFPACSICLNGNDIGNLNGVIGSQTCLQVDQMARAGELSPVVCAIYQSITSDALDPCNCFPDPSEYLCWNRFWSSLLLTTIFHNVAANSHAITYCSLCHSTSRSITCHSSTNSSADSHAY